MLCLQTPCWHSCLCWRVWERSCRGRVATLQPTPRCDETPQTYCSHIIVAPWRVSVDTNYCPGLAPELLGWAGCTAEEPGRMEDQPLVVHDFHDGIGWSWLRELSYFHADGLHVSASLCIPELQTYDSILKSSSVVLAMRNASEKSERWGKRPFRIFKCWQIFHTWLF